MFSYDVECSPAEQRKQGALSVLDRVGKIHVYEKCSRKWEVLREQTM